MLMVACDSTYFDSSGVEHIPKEIQNFIAKKISKEIVTEYNHTIQ